MDIQKGTILITGASGSLGKQLAYELSKSGVKPVAQVRTDSDTVFIDALGLEKRYADLRHREELAKLVSGVDAIMHTAAWVNFRQDRHTEFVAINTMGAANLYRAAARAGVKRFVHVSTVAAVGAVPHLSGKTIGRTAEVADENQQFNLNHLSIPYIMTKHAAEMELLALSKDCSTELVIVNPSIIVAPSRTGDDRGKALRSFSRSVMPRLPNRVNLVDIRDVAPGVISALAHGRSGEKYILAGDNIRLSDLIQTIAAILDKSPRLIKPPRAILNLAAHLNIVYSKLTGRRKISFYPDLIKMMDFDWTYSSAKAKDELGFTPRALHNTLNDLLANNFTDSYMKPVTTTES